MRAIRRSLARDVHLHLRIKSDLRATLERLAAADRRSLSSYVEKVLEEHAASATQTNETLVHSKTDCQPVYGSWHK